jgi:hypothetical protein
MTTFSELEKADEDGAVKKQLTAQKPVNQLKGPVNGGQAS